MPRNQHRVRLRRPVVHRRRVRLVEPVRRRKRAPHLARLVVLDLRHREQAVVALHLGRHHVRREEHRLEQVVEQLPRLLRGCQRVNIGLIQVNTG